MKNNIQQVITEAVDVLGDVPRIKRPLLVDMLPVMQLEEYIKNKCRTGKRR